MERHAFIVTFRANAMRVAASGAGGVARTDDDVRVWLGTADEVSLSRQHFVILRELANKMMLQALGSGANPGRWLRPRGLPVDVRALRYGA